jgi:tetratricopeptide (TPR) repeat protein
MKHFKLILLFLGAFHWLQAKAADVNWFDRDFPTALEVAQETKKNVFVVFHATWCGPCQYLIGTTLHDPEVAKRINDQTLPIAIDIDQNHALAKKYRVKGYPTIILLRPSGEEVERIIHYPANLLLQQLHDALTAGRTISELEVELSQDSQNPQLKFELLHKNAQQGNIERAMSFKEDLENNHGEYYKKVREAALRDLARACVFADRLEEAVLFFREIIDEVPGADRLYAFIQLAQCYFLNHLPDDGFATLEEALVKLPNEVSLYEYYLGFADSKKTNLKRAVEIGEKGLSLQVSNEDAAELRYDLAVVYKDLGRIDEARSTIDKAIALNPLPQYLEFRKSLAS